MTIADCEVCGMSFCDSPVDVATHRRWHRAHLRFARPHRDKRLDRADPWVTSASPNWKHRIVRQFAIRFRRELCYFGGPTWPEDASEVDARWRAFIFLDDQARAIGCSVFSLGEYSDAPDDWVLAWVYVVPPARRLGVLRRHWPMFRATFGDFLIDPPLSPSMADFARKHATPAQLPHAGGRGRECDKEPNRLKAASHNAEAKSTGGRDQIA